MSDQPKPATGCTHPPEDSCPMCKPATGEPCSKDMVNLKGERYPLQPTTGEWTADYVADRFTIDASSAGQIADAYNAAIASERKEFEELEQLYRENNQDHYKEVGDLQQQLAAERENIEICRSTISSLNKQLAAEKAK